MKDSVFEQGVQVTLVIESIASTGKGVGTLVEEGFKHPVFVAGTVPGDVVTVRLTRRVKRYYEGVLLDIVQPSPERIVPSCAHFGQCGACDFLHVSYRQQLVSKEQLLRHFLQRAAIAHPQVQVVPAEQEKHYRMKARVFSRGGRVGFCKKESNEVVQIRHCDLVYEPINEVFEKSRPSGEYSVGFDAKEHRVAYEGLCHYMVAGCELAFYPSSFVQSNAAMNEKLVRLVLSLIPRGTVLDLYAGNGNFSIPLAKQGNRVMSVEGNRKSHELARLNAEKNAVEPSSVCKPVEEFLKEDKRTYDTILLNPPRSGAMQIVPELYRANTLVYVSCNAQTLAKELMLLLEHYTLDSIHLLDMFPQTRHFETVVCLKKNA